ncbi:MAG: DsbA family protein [Myxococcota bacterium]
MYVWSLLVLVACGGNGATTSAAPVAAGPPPVAATAPPTANEAEAVVASWEGGKLTYADLKKDIDVQLVQLEAEYLTNRFDTEAQALEERVAAALVDAEAKARGMDVEALLRAEVEDKAGAPTEAEVQELYNANARKLRGAPLEQVRPDVEKAIRQRKAGERYVVYVDELKKKYGVVTQLPYPELPRFPVSADDDPFEGPADAPVTIIQFAEFQCPYCGKARESLDQIKAAYPGKVRFVFRDFPLGFHDRAIPAAVAANCAAKQGKYWEVHDRLMSNQRALEEPDLERVAQEAKLNMSDWQACRQDPAMRAEVEKDMEDGAKIGVTGTPAFFVNGVMLSGAQPFERFKAIIDRELAKG